jgi:HAD superfamily hydrolase (TIGR01509 family)
MIKPKLIIFDCDGVLVDSETITNQILVDYINEFGTDLSLESALELFRGGALADCISYVDTTYGIKLPEEFSTNFRQRMKVAFEKELTAVEGIKELLNSLDQAVCVASNGPLEKMETTLKVTGLKKYFGENIYSAYQINKWKPEPDLFLHAANKMGVSPEDSVVIEDSPRGVEAARLAGMRVYGFDVYGKTDELKNEGAVVFKKLVDLIGVFS